MLKFYKKLKISAVTVYLNNNKKEADIYIEKEKHIGKFIDFGTGYIKKDKFSWKISKKSNLLL